MLDLGKLEYTDKVHWWRHGRSTVKLNSRCNGFVYILAPVTPVCYTILDTYRPSIYRVLDYWKLSEKSLLMTNMRQSYDSLSLLYTKPGRTISVDILWASPWKGYCSITALYSMVTGFESWRELQILDHLDLRAGFGFFP